MTIRILPLAAALLLGGCVTYSYHQADGGGDYYYGDPQSQYGYVVPYAYPYGYGYGYGYGGGYYGGGYGYYGYHGGPYSPYWYNPYYYGAHGYHHHDDYYRHHYRPYTPPPGGTVPPPRPHPVPLDRPDDGVAWREYRRAPRPISTLPGADGGRIIDDVQRPMPSIAPPPRTTSPRPPMIRPVTTAPPPSFSPPPPPPAPAARPRVNRTERAQSRYGDQGDR